MDDKSKDAAPRAGNGEQNGPETAPPSTGTGAATGRGWITTRRQTGANGEGTMTGRIPLVLKVALLAGAVALAASGRAAADDISQEALSLRLPAALTRFAPYGDVAGVGGASAGSKWSSSVNPASVAWEPDLRLSVSPQYSNVHFEEHLSLHIAAESLTADLGDCGRIQPALAQVRSTKSTTRQGLDFRLDMDLVQVQWARKVDADTAVGVNFNFTKSRQQYDLGRVAVSDSDSETYGWRLGVLRRLCDDLGGGRVLGGVVFDYAFSPSRTTMYDFLGLGTGDQRIKDTAHQFVLRPGVSWEYKKDSAVYADYLFGSFHDDTGRLRVHRFMVGVDHEVVEGLFSRGGVTMDTHGNTAWACGVGIYPCDRVAIDLAYQDNMFPELEVEFGRSRTLTVSVSFSF